jgi:hypothetical protein
MATNVDPNIALSAKAPDSMTGLGQMMNIARGAQAYQQNAESFPTLLEQQKLALNRGQQLLPIEVRTAEQGAQSAEIANNVKRMQLQGSAAIALENSDAFKTGDVSALKKQLSATEAWLNSHGLPSQKGGVVSQLHDLFDKNDLSGAQALLGNVRAGLASASEQYAAALPSVGETGGQPSTFTRAGPTGGQIRTAPIDVPTPTAQPAPTTTGSTTAMPVAAPPKTVARPAPFVVNNVDINEPETPKYPVRVSGKVTAPATSEETGAQTAGNSYYTSLSMEQPKLARQVDNLRNVVSQATKLQGTMLGAGEKSESAWAQLGNDALRKVYTNVAVKLGSTELQELAKDLANVQTSISAAGGTRTDAGLDLVKIASGTEKTSPEVLIKIAQRTMAEVKNIDSQTAAARKFKDKFGTNNMEAFQRMWGKNADTRVFQIMNVVDSVKDPKEQKALLGQIYGGDTKELAAGLQKYRNIKKLMADGTL